MQFLGNGKYISVLLMIILAGCGGPAHSQGSVLAKKVAQIIFENHGCDVDKFGQNCGDISVHFSPGFGVTRLIIDGNISDQDVSDVLSSLDVFSLRADLKLIFVNKKLSVYIKTDE